VPDDATAYERFDADGVALFVHRDVLAGADPERLSFAFGKFGGCAVRVEPSSR
jgi:hypothetical protein